MKIDGMSSSGGFRRGMKKDKEQAHLFKKRKQAQNKLFDFLLQQEIERAHKL